MSQLHWWGRARSAAACIAAATVCYASLGRADSGAGAFRLGSGITLVNAAGYPDTATEATVAAGVAPPALALSLGYQAVDSVLIGLRTTLAYQGLNLGGTTFDVGIVSVLPNVEILFGKDTFVPFVGAQLGPRVTVVEGAGADTTLVIGPTGGLHIFATKDFSVSPELWGSFLYRPTVSRAGWEIGVAISFLGWMFGG